MLAYKKIELPITQVVGAGGAIRTHELLQDRVLSPAPLARLGNPRTF